MYHSSEGVAKNLVQAVEWFRKSAEQGNSDGQWRLGCMYEYGDGIDKDLAQAIEWYRKSAEQGDSDSQWRLGSMYVSYDEIEKNPEQALYWINKSADQGNTLATMFLGAMYIEGIGVEKDPTKGLELLYKSADSGNSYAQTCLGRLYKEDTEGILERDIYKAIEWWKKAAENEYPEPEAMYLLGYAYYDGEGVERDLNKAKEYFQKALNSGYNCSYALNMVKGELGELDTPNKMREYADSLIKKRLFGDKLINEILKGLQKDFGSNWSRVCPSTKEFLRTGMYTYINYYSLGEHQYKNFDFSPVITQLCKALEKELGKYLYSGYIEYLKENNISPDQFSSKNRSFIARKNANEFIFKKSTEESKFTLGSMGATVGYDELKGLSSAGSSASGFAGGGKFKNGVNKFVKKGADKSPVKVEYTIDSTMVSYLSSIFKDDAFSQDNREREITDYVVMLTQEVTAIADSHRNPAAHSSTMTCNKAEACGNSIIKVQKLLINFLNMLKD